MNDWNSIAEIDEESIRLREEINLQYQALGEVVRLGDLYGLDVRKPAMNVKEAIQWINIAFMAGLPRYQWCCNFSWTCPNRSGYPFAERDPCSWYFH